MPETESLLSDVGTLLERTTPEGVRPLDLGDMARRRRRRHARRRAAAALSVPRLPARTRGRRR